MLTYLKRFKNTGTIVSLAGLILILLNQFGVNVNIEGANEIINTICSILVVLGICNNPTTNGLDTP